MQAPSYTNSGLSRCLLSYQLLDSAQLEHAATAAQQAEQSLAHYLCDKKLVATSALMAAVSQEFGVPQFDLTSFDLDQLPKQQLNTDLITKHQVLPLFKRGSRLFIAVADPTQIAALDEFKFNTGLSTEAILVDPLQLQRSIETTLQANELSALDDVGDSELDNLDTEEESATTTGDNLDGDDAPVVRYVNKTLLNAIRKEASDIHFEPYERYYRVRMRIDGVLREVARPPIKLATRITARLKVMSRLDIAEKRVPQDGRMKLKLSPTRAIDFRVSSCPTLFGEKVVLRILDSSSAKLGIDALGYEPIQKQHYLSALNKPQGMILVTGPTGSGKTVSLYTGLNILNTDEHNISTAEDPAEINLPGINQVNINTKAGLDFASALRAFLRQDPDIIMVGEIRDLETAEIAIKAAQTGHLVLSTLHTNSAPETLTRLVNMGVQSFNIATSVSLVIAQRLARRLCNHCKRPQDVPQDSLLDNGFSPDQLTELVVYGPQGCDQCTGGYKGRVGIYQVMPISETMGRIIMDGGNALDIAEQAQREGVSDLRQSALQKVQQGITSLEEVNRVTKD